jgi:hypothetical protein
VFGAMTASDTIVRVDLVTGILKGFDRCWASRISRRIEGVELVDVFGCLGSDLLHRDREPEEVILLFGDEHSFGYPSGATLRLSQPEACRFDFEFPDEVGWIAFA